jgi:uncharacterized membrane protein
MARGRTSRASQILLLVCLAIGLLLAGFVAGHFEAARHMMMPPKSSPQAMIDHFVHNLPQADADTLRAAFKDDQAALQKALDDLAAARRNVRAKLMAAPFDKSALNDAMDSARKDRDALAMVVQKIIMGAIDKISPEGRARLFEPGPH